MELTSVERREDEVDPSPCDVLLQRLRRVHKKNQKENIVGLLFPFLYKTEQNAQSKEESEAASRRLGAHRAHAGRAGSENERR